MSLSDEMAEAHARQEEFDALQEQYIKGQNESLRNQLHFAITMIGELLAIDYRAAGMKLAERMQREREA